jgi:NAD+ synthase
MKPRKCLAFREASLIAPYGGLFQGQTDEGELGVTYAQLDDYLLGKEVSEKVKNRIEHLHRISEHKRNPIPRPAKFSRGSK